MTEEQFFIGFKHGIESTILDKREISHIKSIFDYPSKSTRYYVFMKNGDMISVSENNIDFILKELNINSETKKQD